MEKNVYKDRIFGIKIKFYTKHGFLMTEFFGQHLENVWSKSLAKNEKKCSRG